VTISRSLKFGTVEPIPNRKANTLLQAIRDVIRLYSSRGFRVCIGMMDGEFEPLRADLLGLGISLNIASHGEHVPDIERYIRTLKERVRSTYNTLPFKHIPNVMLVEMVRAGIFWLNNFPQIMEFLLP
jgi:hypothetical protein